MSLMHGQNLEPYDIRVQKSNERFARYVDHGNEILKNEREKWDLYYKNKNKEIETNRLDTRMEMKRLEDAFSDRQRNITHSASKFKQSLTDQFENEKKKLEKQYENEKIKLKVNFDQENASKASVLSIHLQEINKQEATINDQKEYQIKMDKLVWEKNDYIKKLENEYNMELSNCQSTVHDSLNILLENKNQEMLKTAKLMEKIEENTNMLKQIQPNETFYTTQNKVQILQPRRYPTNSRY